METGTPPKNWRVTLAAMQNKGFMIPRSAGNWSTDERQRPWASLKGGGRASITLHEGPNVDVML